MKLIMTKGLPASGKSTWSKKQVRESKGKLKRINKDDLRAMIDDGVWGRENEEQILKVRDKLIVHYLSHGYDVVVDDTNLVPKHEKTLQEIAEGFQATFEVKSFLDVPLLECIKRDFVRPNSVGENVIKNMFNRYVKPKVIEYEKPEYNPDLPECIIVDVDGTLAHMNGRSPYDYSKVDTDILDETVAEIVRRYYNSTLEGPYIIILSGREDSCASVTEQWLQDNNVPYHEIHMRKTGDVREDSIVKKEIYEEYIKPRYNVKFVLDDRNRVVKMWREQGLKVLQVADGDF